MQTVGAILDIATSVLSTVEPTDSVYEAATHMSALGVHALLVVDGNSLAVGIMTESDVISRVIAAELDPSEVTVAEVMTNGPVMISPKASIEEALALMTECCHDQLVVADDGEVCGILSLGDISQFLVDDRDAAITNLTFYITHG